MSCADSEAFVSGVLECQWWWRAGNREEGTDLEATRRKKVSGSVTDKRVKESSRSVSARLTGREGGAVCRHRAVGNGADSRKEGLWLLTLRHSNVWKRLPWAQGWRAWLIEFTVSGPFLWPVVGLGARTCPGDYLEHGPQTVSLGH